MTLGLVLLSSCAAAHTVGPAPTAAVAHAVAQEIQHSRPAQELPLKATPARWRLPAPVSREVAVTEQTSVLIAGGLDGAGQSTASVFRLNPRSGAVTQAGSLATPTHDAAGAMLRGQVFVFGGGTAQSTAEVQALVPSSGGRAVGRLPRPRSDLTGVVWGNHIYLLGGYDGYTLDPQVLDTADGIHFRIVANLRVPVRYPAAAAVAGRLFVFGGLAGTGDTAAIQAVDLRAHRVRVVGRLPSPVSHAMAVVLRDYVYILGGVSAGVTSRRIWSFDPSTGRVRQAGMLPVALSDAGIAVIGATAYLIGGEATGTPTASVISLRTSP